MTVTLSQIVDLLVPDAEKLEAYAVALLAVEVPEVTEPEAVHALATARSLLDGLTDTLRDVTPDVAVTS